MTQKFEMMKTQVKDNILVLINEGRFTEAQGLLNEYRNIVSNDIEVFSVQSVIDISNRNFEAAQKSINDGLSIDNNNFDLRYNLAYLYELRNEPVKAVKMYRQLSQDYQDKEKQQLIVEAFERLRIQYPEIDVMHKKQRMVFFVKQGMDSFIGDIISNLSKEYETKKVVVTDLRQIDKEMLDADICWFEWCDELVIYGSQLEAAKRKKLICRLHSYEAFIDYPKNVNWNTVDITIFVAEHIRNTVLGQVSALKKERTVIIPNGIDINKYTFKTRNPGYKIAYLGYINYKKGPMLLLHTFSAIHACNPNYKLYIAGTFQDNRDVLYFQQFIKEMNLENCVIYDGWQNDVDKWLDDKDYILCTSVLEGHPVGIMQAMAKGLKPLIHNFVGARGIYPGEYIWNTIDEAVGMICSKEYDSAEYRDFIKDNYLLHNKYIMIDQIIQSLFE
jgi:glycosyltransferase involved in cell wall biosynthesis